jgi:hypothetical protein
MYPSDVAQAAAKRGDEPMLKRALAAQQIFGNAPGLSSQIQDIARAGAVGAAAHTVAGGAAIPAVVVSMLGTLPMGRKLLLGQTTWQQFVTQHPQMARAVAQAMRSTATQGVPVPQEQEAP